MKITEEEVRNVADLANLRLSQEELTRLQSDLDEILAHMDHLREVDTTGVEPMAQVLYDAEETATLRRDEERTPLGHEIALANAPLASRGYFKVPLVMER